MNVRTWEVVRVFRDKKRILRRVAEKQARGGKTVCRRTENQSQEIEKSFG